MEDETDSGGGGEKEGEFEFYVDRLVKSVAKGLDSYPIILLV